MSIKPSSNITNITVVNYSSDKNMSDQTAAEQSKLG